MRFMKVITIITVLIILAGCQNLSKKDVVLPTPNPAIPTLVIEEHPIVDQSVDTPDHIEFNQRIPAEVLNKRIAERNLSPTQMVEPQNRLLENFGYHLAPDPIASYYSFQLYQHQHMILDQISSFSPVTVNRSGSDFILLLDMRDGRQMLVQKDKLAAWNPGHYSYAQPVYAGDELLIAYSEGEKVSFVVVVKSGKRKVFEVPVEATVRNPIDGFWGWAGHWVLEVNGQVFVDGVSLNQKLGYDEIFYWQLVAGEPFFFFRKGGKIGVSYDGMELPYSYEEVIHYRCCEEAAFNPRSNGQMVWFYGLKNHMWTYVEAGIFGKAQ